MFLENQLGFGDNLLSHRTKTSKLSKRLDLLDELVDWQPIVEELAIIDQISPKTGVSRKNRLWMIKAILYSICSA